VILKTEFALFGDTSEQVSGCIDPLKSAASHPLRTEPF